MFKYEEKGILSGRPILLHISVVMKFGTRYIQGLTFGATSNQTGQQAPLGLRMKQSTIRPQKILDFVKSESFSTYRRVQT